MFIVKLAKITKKSTNHVHIQIGKKLNKATKEKKHMHFLRNS
jgi:hypothetical protein